MDIESITDVETNITDIKVTSKMLDEFLLWRINTGILFRDGLKLIYDKKPDGSVMLRLLSIPSWMTFEYEQRAESKAFNAWEDFRHSRPED